ncbi:hypothetical protein [Streptomyces sp. NBC_01264]|uniref:hypothetical protein n=1 Tax=Streptomyces sp. NBC_01264 TaxID=2903804 RepID=UPI00225A1132|nr:hypothetical protein [Streptomyces sp. NBC_01264]MCX4778120.1 hypothetical protein [Streptomyces sp. NBC_01264]
MMETLIDLAIVVFVFTAAWVIRRLTRDDDTQRWRESTSVEDGGDDVAERRRKREIAQLEAWLHHPYRPRNTIPHQTRRTEEDQ